MNLSWNQYGALLAVVLATSPLSAVVISEIHYHPPLGQEGLEFVEITNEADSPEDISGWALVEGIRFEFPPGLILRGGESLVVCADVEALRSHYGIQNAVGNYEGRLDGSGERLTLVNHVGIVVDRLRYRDEGKWPVAPDGTGHSLVLKSLNLDTSEPESWTQSQEIGGSPGLADLQEFTETVLVEVGDEWRFRKGTEPFSVPESAWREPGFDDSSWPVGPSGFGYGDGEHNTILDDMQQDYDAFAIRKRVVLEEGHLDESSSIFFAMLYDDGFCAFVNGIEVARVNCNDPVWNGGAAISHEAAAEELFAVPREVFQPGENVLALVGLNRLRRTGRTEIDFTLTPRMLHRRGLPPQRAVVFNELFRAAAAGGGWVEIYNAGSVERDVSGWNLTDDPDRDDPHVFPPGTTIPAGGFLVVEEGATTLTLSAPRVQLFLSNSQSLVEAAFTFDRQPAGGLALGEYSEVLFPDGGTEVWMTPTSTRGSANDVPRVTDLVINEIFYHPPEDRAGEFLELFNRGTEELDLSGFSFTKGIEYTFLAGTSLAAGAYLVLADDPQIIEERYGFAGALGWSGGVLSNGGENLRLVDRLGNLVDEVRYFEGGEWSLWADGRGSSLELIDPYQNNDFGMAWGASDETEKSVWEEHSFAVPSYTATQESELNLLLVERGVCRIDDVSIVEQPESGAGNFIPNPGFEEDTGGWLIGGTHVHSERITQDAHSGDACLEVVATSKGDDLCNRIEVETEPSLEPGRAYEVSLWARWLRGSSLLVVHGEFGAGSWPGERDVNLSGNPLAARIRMSVPTDLGTPGAENSRRVALREETGSDNLGPVMTDIVHAPASPPVGLPVSVQARVSDSDGVATVRAYFKEDALDTVPFQSVELFENGATYVGAIPSLSEQRGQVSFYVEAMDALGAVTRFPPEDSERTLVYRTETHQVLAQFAEFSDLQVFLSARSKEALAARPATSNDLVDGTVVLDDEQVRYTVGIRYRGSPWHRPQPLSLRLRFADDRRFRERLRDINLSNLDRGNGVGYFLLGRNGTAEKPVAVADYKYIRARFNGDLVGKLGLYEPIDKDFIERWYGDAAARDGVVIKANGRRRFSDNCQLDGWDETTLRHRDENSENYRFYWTHSIHQTRDNWQPLIDGTRILESSDEEFDRLFESVVDVEAFLRVLIPRILMNDGDSLFWGNGHNGQLFWESMDAGFQYIPFDFGGSFRNVAADLLAVKDENVRRIVTHPRGQRLYSRLIYEYLQGYWSVEAAGPFLDALEEEAGVGASAASFLRTSRGNYLQLLQPFFTVELRILTNSGEDFTAETPTVRLEGEAPVLMTSFQLRANDGTPQAFEPTWNSATEWSTTLLLRETVNRLEILGFDQDESLAGSAAITISRAGGEFIRGDSNGDLSVNVLDAIATIFFLFQGLPLPCPDAADFDDTGTVNIRDALGILGYLFRHEAPPPAPFPEAGIDPTEDGMDCEG